MQRITPRLDRLYQREVRGLRAGLAKKNVVYAVMSVNAMCTNCVYDATNRCGSGIYNGTGPQAFDGRVFRHDAAGGIDDA